MTTTRRSRMRIEISRVHAPSGDPAVLIQADEFYLLMWPRDAVNIAKQMTEVAEAIMAEDGSS